MTQMTVKSILALCVVGAVVCQDPAPAPAGYVTAAPDPAPAPAPFLAPALAPATTTVAATTAAATATTAAATATTGAAATYSHQVSLGVTITNVSLLTNEAALQAVLQTAIGSAAGGTANVTISAMQVLSLFSGLPDGFNTTKFIIAYANLTGIHHSTVTTNNASHPNAGGRRLLEDANVVATVSNDGSDVVVATKAVIGATTVSGLASALAAQGVSTTNLALPSPPGVKVVITSSVTGSTVASIDQSALASAVDNAVPGGASVSDVSVTNSGSTSAPGVTVTVTGSVDTAQDSGSISIVAPAMTIWVAMYAFMMA